MSAVADPIETGSLRSTASGILPPVPESLEELAIPASIVEQLVLKYLYFRGELVGRDIAVIFTTAYDTYAMRAFDAHAVDYLLKPFDKKRVALAVQKARAQQGAEGLPVEKIDALVRMLQAPKAQTSKILLKAGGRMFLVDQKEICYASIEDGVITVVTAGASGMEGHSNCRTLEELLASLDPGLFWRAHRSYLVNINRIREVVPWFKSSYQLRMEDKKQSEIPVSRAQTKRLRELFGL